MVSGNKYAVTFDSSSIGVLKRGSIGVIGIKLGNDDAVAFSAIAEADGSFVMENVTYNERTFGAGKRGTKGKSLN